MTLQFDRDDIESSLVFKGFVKEYSHHRYFYHEVDGRRTGVSTHTSHGSQYKTYGDNLLKQMRRQLRLETTRQLSDLIKCPMTGEDYKDFLRKKGLL
jgi:hypothetical protein